MQNQGSTSKLVHFMRFMIRLHRSQLLNDDSLPEEVATNLALIHQVAHRTGNDRWFAQNLYKGKGKDKGKASKGKGKDKGKKGCGKWHGKDKSSSSSGWWY